MEIKKEDIKNTSLPNLGNEIGTVTSGTFKK